MIQRETVPAARHELRVGDDALEIVARLPQLLRPAVRVFTFHMYAPSVGLNERLHGTGEAGDALAEASWWRTAEQIIAQLKASSVESVVANLLNHDQEEEKRQRFDVAADELTSGHLRSIINNLPAGKVLALRSQCRLETGEWGHLPLMDFHCPPTANHLEIALVALRHMGQRRGAVLESGRSYHYYGFDILTQEDWLGFLGHCLLLTPFTDSRYIAHRLLGGSCALRISASGRKPTVPRLIWILQG